jgi:hypothetical protein
MNPRLEMAEATIMSRIVAASHGDETAIGVTNNRHHITLIAIKILAGNRTGALFSIVD